MNKEQDYASDTDESDEDFHPENLAGQSAASEEDSESIEELEDDSEKYKETPVKRKRLTKKLNKKKNEKSKHDDDSENEPTHTSRRATRQTVDTQVNGNGKDLEKIELVSDEEDTSRSNALWADFLKNADPTASVTKVTSKENPSSSGSNKIDASENKRDVSKKVQSTNSVAPKVEENKVVLTEVVDFAGEEVHIVREVDASSIKENKAAAMPQAKKQPFSRILPGVGIKRTIPTGSGSGLGSVLNQLGKKKKLSVLEKSQMDWKSFKQSEGIDEQLQTFNKGKDG